MQKDKVLILTSTFAADTTALSGYDIVFNTTGRRLSEGEVTALLDERVVGIIAGLEPYTIDVIQQAPHLKVISRCGTGVDNIDSQISSVSNITIYNTPDEQTESVAELTIALILSLYRHLHTINQDVKAAQWPKVMGHLIRGKKVGIVGLGRIGKRVAELLEVFGASIYFHDTAITDNYRGYIAQSLDDMINHVDILSLHIPLDNSTRNIIHASRLGKLPINSILINTARGELIDEDALLLALSTNKIQGAALDVFINEPYLGPLVNLHNVLLTSHIGSYTQEARRAQENKAIANLLEGLNKEL